MSNEVTYEQFMAMTNAEIDALPLYQLAQIRDAIDEMKAEVKEADATLAAATLRRCETQARAALREQGKDTGSITIPGEDGFNFEFEIPKKVDWDQAALQAVVEGMAKAGKTVKQIQEYVTFKFTVPEGKFNAWPSEIQAGFLPARMVEPGTVKAKIVEAKQSKKRK